MYKKSKILPLIRKELEDCACLGVAIRRSGLKSPYTVNLWRKANPRIDNYLKACIAKSDNRRNDVVVDSLFKSAKDGNMTAVAIWLKYKMGWREAYEGPTVNVYTQIWNRTAIKTKDVDANGRVHIEHQKEMPA